MKIGNSPDGTASPPKAERPASRKPEAASTTDIVRQTAQAATSSPSAQVAISNTAKIAAAQGNDDGSFDAAKVARISKAISEGKFTVNANAIADKLVSNAQELLDSRVNKH
ncbi:flagellar biosynthesis anti-sigma factor FlgM [Roseateles sp. NT4]|uniref:flagellar biosynthesis anti-sigma factor FlgM n=1 Tax=Roseateles sp. NT4 TaxID=3453715 RepID=UPI003EEB2A0F